MDENQALTQEELRTETLVLLQRRQELRSHPIRSLAKTQELERIRNRLKAIKIASSPTGRQRTHRAALQRCRRYQMNPTSNGMNDQNSRYNQEETEGAMVSLLSLTLIPKFH